MGSNTAEGLAVATKTVEAFERATVVFSVIDILNSVAKASNGQIGWTHAGLNIAFDCAGFICPAATAIYGLVDMNTPNW
jgi:hypothetical protein